MSKGKSVATRDPEIESFRGAGQVALARKKEVTELANQIAGMEWGSGNRAIQGASFSPETRMALAHFCRVTRAHPQRHVDILGGGPYLNAEYWAERINEHSHFIRYEQIDLSPSVEEEIRDRAKRHLELSKKLEEDGRQGEATSRRAKALDLEEEADAIRARRKQWSPRASATVVIETIIYRFMNQAPIEKIKAGAITDFDKYIIEVRECNWAGGLGNELADKKKWDPIGDMDPGKTARTRSLRRAAVKAFSAWMQEYDREIQQAEQHIEAEFEIVQEHDRDDVVSTGGGEAQRGGRGEVRNLPSRGEEGAGEVVTGEIVEEEEPDSFDRDDARKKLFATLNAAGLKDNDMRKDWSESNKLPRSTSEWKEADFDRAIKLLMDPVVEEVEALAKKLDQDIGDLSLVVLGKDRPEYLKEWNALHDVLRTREANDAKKTSDKVEGEL